MSKQASNWNYYKNFIKKEASMLRSQIDEVIGRFGIDVVYLKRNTPNIDKLFGEDHTSIFDTGYNLTALPEGIENWNTGQDLFSNFGFSSNFTQTLFIEQERFTNETGLDQPVENDLIYVDLYQKFYEITYTNPREIFYVSGELYVYKIEIQEFEYSHEDITYDDPDGFVQGNLPTDEQFVDSDNDVVDDENKEDMIIEEFDNILEED